MKFEDLKFVRLTRPEQFSLVPRYLFEQVKGGDFNIDRLLQFGPMLLASPLTYFYILAEKEQLEKGYAPAKGLLWAEVNPFNENVHAHLFSIDKEYQHDGAMSGAIKKLKEIREKENLTGKLTSETNRPKAVEKAGWQKSKIIYMEI